jgi:glycosyltransferase involved in cell wall biosynthesis
MQTRRELRSLAIVTPFYDEQDNIGAFYKRLLAVLEPLGLSPSFVFVDDGSRDRTLTLLNELADADPRITVLSLARNFGHQVALSAGLDYAEGDAVVTMDGDLQHPPEVIPEMLREFEAGSDVVYGVRQSDRTHDWAKQIVARTFYAVLRRMTKVEVLSGAADFRLMSREVVQTLCQMREMHRYLRGMVPWMGFPYTIVTYEQPNRHAGKPKYTWSQSGQLARNGIFSFSTVPLEVITWVGFVLTCLSGLYLIFVLATAFFASLPSPVPGWTSVIAVLLVVSGVQLISIGILAQYVGMIFEQVKGRPLYTLKQVKHGSAARAGAQPERVTGGEI